MSVDDMAVADSTAAAPNPVANQVFPFLFSLPLNTLPCEPICTRYGIKVSIC
jgi:hypothetical protein